MPLDLRSPFTGRASDMDVIACLTRRKRERQTMGQEEVRIVDNEQQAAAQGNSSAKATTSRSMLSSLRLGGRKSAPIDRSRFAGRTSPEPFAALPAPSPRARVVTARLSCA